MQRSLALTLLLVLPSLAHAQVKLAWKLKEGEQFFVHKLDKVRQTIKIMETENRQDLDQDQVIRFTLLKKNGDGSLVFDQKIESVKIKHSGEGPQTDTRVLKQFEGASFQITVDAQGKVTKLVGYEPLLKEISKNNRVHARLIRAVMTEDSFKVLAAGLLGFVPEKEVAKGDSWQRKTALPLGPLGRLDLTTSYTLASVNDGAQTAKVNLAGTAVYQLPPEDEDLSLKITGGDLRLIKSSGTIDFDIAHGRLIRLETRQVLEGTLRASLREAKLDMAFHQEQETTLQVSGKNPLEK